MTHVQNQKFELCLMMSENLSSLLMILVFAEEYFWKRAVKVVRVVGSTLKTLRDTRLIERHGALMTSAKQLEQIIECSETIVASNSSREKLLTEPDP